MVIVFFVLFGAVNSAFSQLGYDLISFLPRIYKPFYLIVGVFAIMMALNKNTWLPFLGESVLPSILVQLKKIEGNKTVKVHVKPNVKVAYWATKPTNKKPDPNVRDAYDDYSNSGVVMSDENGIAILTLNKGSGYYVPTGKHIEPHLHYRELTDDFGMMGPVKTYYF